MKFFSKILLSTLILCLGGAGAVCWLDVRSANSTARQVYFVHYETLGRSLGATFTELERATDSVVLNAEQVFASLQAEQNILYNQDKLRSLANILQVSSIGSFDEYGLSELFSNSFDDGRGRADLFKLCGDYRQLMDPNAKPVVLPFTLKAWANADGFAPEKYAMGPSADGKHILSAALLNRNLAGFLQEAISVDPSILRLVLSTQDGRELATAGAADPPPSQPIDITSADSLDDESHDTVVLHFKVPSSISYCCECFTKGQIKDPYDTSYRLAMTVSARPLHQSTQARRHEAWSIFAGVAVASLLLGLAVVRRLVHRIEGLSAATQEVLRTGDLMVRAPEGDGNDELAVLSRGFNTMMRTLKENETFRAQQASMEAIAEVAAQAAHDIRSPVVALHVVADRGQDLPEELRLLMRDALRRIHDIANNLLSKHKITRQTAGPRAELMAPLVHSALSEQRVARGHQEIDYSLECTAEAHEAFCTVDPVLLRRVLSNLLNNASEAIASTGTVRVSLDCTEDDLEISIADNGCGIPEHLVSQVLAGGNTFGKQEGHGMGVRSAVDALRSWHGDLKINSQEGSGTTITLCLPLQNAAPWFAHALYVDSSKPVFILDDDEAMGRLWTERLVPMGVQVRVFRSAAAFSAAVQQSANIGACWVDFELLGEPRDGLEVVRHLGIEAQSVLVTSYYDEEPVRSATLTMGMRIVPKTYAAHVPILVDA